MPFVVDVGLIIFAAAVMKIVHGIKSSTKAEGTVKIFRVLKASVIECPMVNAVTKMSTCFHSFKVYKTVSTNIKSW